MALDYALSRSNPTFSDFTMVKRELQPEVRSQPHEPRQKASCLYVEASFIVDLSHVVPILQKIGLSVVLQSFCVMFSLDS